MQTIKSYKDLQNADLEKIALAAEADAGQALPGLRESLAEARALGKSAPEECSSATHSAHLALAAPIVGKISTWQKTG